MVKVKAFELRKKDQDQLKKQVEDLKTELSSLKVAKVAGGAPAKLAKIKSLRKSVASVLTVIHEKKRDKIKAESEGKKYLPLDIRPKRTRAIRRRLTKKQASKLLLRVIKRKSNFPQRKFSVAS
jgi:large subunit ribosomal protein L35e